MSFRLLATTGIALAIISGSIMLAITLLLRWGPEILIDRELSSSAAHVIKGIRYNVGGLPADVNLDYRLQAAYEALHDDAVYRLLDQDGRVLLASDQATLPLSPDDGKFDPARQRFSVTRTSGVAQVKTQAFTHDGQQFYVQIMRSERMYRIMLDLKGEKVQTITSATALLAMLLFSAVVVAMLHRLLKPLRRAAAAASAIELNNLSTRLSLDGVPCELTPLFEAFNLALERLDQGYRVQRDFLASAAHELKTPLTLIRAQVELDEDLNKHGALLTDLDHMARQVSQLLHLAEASEPQNYTMQELDAAMVASEAAVYLQRLAQSRSVSLTLATLPAVVKADNSALFVLLRNLIENAIHHAPAQSRVDVVVNAGSISVRDHGNGIAPESMPLLFKRFWRGAHRRDIGAGLGLSICEEIARAHGWHLTAANANPGALFVLNMASGGSQRR